MAKSIKKSKVTKENDMNNFLSKIKWDESYISLAVGVVVVIVVALIGVAFVKNNKNQETSSTQFKPNIEFQSNDDNSNTVADENKAPVVASKGNYVIKAGDTLWGIAEANYKSGYNWVDIAKANNLSSPDVISAGSKLVIPSVKAKETTIAQATQQSHKANAISGDSYKIQEGDYLWDIAVRAYGDGYSWVKIAKENKIVNPDIIYSGTVLRVPR